MSEPPRKKRKVDETTTVGTRVTRSQTHQEALKSKVQSDKTQHFGLDVTPQVKKAMFSGRKLDEESRRSMRGKIERSTRTTGKLSDVIPKSFAKQLEDQRKSRKTLVQRDNRVAPRKGGSYQGFMMTSSIVSSQDFEPGFKEIPAPSSPNPYQGDGFYHDTHASPFALVGPESNKAKTVNAPGWANISVDGTIEKWAKDAAKTSGTGNVMHFRLDDSQRSTVGYAVFDEDNEDESKRWKVTSAQYKRKFHDM